MPEKLLDGLDVSGLVQHSLTRRIHQNVQFFGTHDELAKKVKAVITKNRDRLIRPPVEVTDWLRATNITMVSPPVNYSFGLGPVSDR